MTDSDTVADSKDSAKSDEFPSLRPLTERNVPSPVTITESRYDGVYSGGEWVIIAGVRNPRQDTEAFGGDIVCPQFWQEREQVGNKYTETIKYGMQSEEVEVYAASGDDPNELIYELFEAYEEDDKDWRETEAEMKEDVAENEELYEALAADEGDDDE